MLIKLKLVSMLFILFWKNKILGIGSNQNSGIGLTRQISEFNNKDDDFSAWIENFELFVLLNEINAHKKN